MKRKRFSVEQITGILKQAEPGAPLAELRRQQGSPSKAITGRRRSTAVWSHRRLGALAQHVTSLRNRRDISPNNKRTVREAFDSWWSLCVEGDDNRGGLPLRLSTKDIYRLTWRVHVEPVWGSRKLSTVRAEEVAHWRQHMLAVGVGPRSVHNVLLMLSVLCKHARLYNDLY